MVAVEEEEQALLEEETVPMGTPVLVEELEEDEEREKLLEEETVPIGTPVLVEELEEDAESEELLEEELERKEELEEDWLEEEEGGGAQTGAHGHPLLSNSHSLSMIAYPNGQ